MGYKPETLEKYGQISNLARSGCSVSEIMLGLSITRNDVYRGLHYYDIKLERDSDRSESLVRKYLDSDLSQAEIARRTGLSTTTVWRTLDQIKNGKKSRFARRAFEPRSIPAPDIAPIWAAEFRGFFYGEGCATMDNEHSSLSPRLTINLRLDDGKILEEIQSKLGGNLYDKGKRGNNNAQRRWTAVGYPLCRVIMESTGLVGQCLLPAKKRRDIDLLYQAILDRYSMNHVLEKADREKLMDYYHRIQEVKRFQL